MGSATCKQLGDLDVAREVEQIDRTRLPTHLVLEGGSDQYQFSGECDGFTELVVGVPVRGEELAHLLTGRQVEDVDRS